MVGLLVASRCNYFGRILLRLDTQKDSSSFAGSRLAESMYARLARQCVSTSLYIAPHKQSLYVPTICVHVRACCICTHEERRGEQDVAEECCHFLATAPRYKAEISCSSRFHDDFRTQYKFRFKYTVSSATCNFVGGRLHVLL